MKVKRTERGWAGHFICASRCLFRRNTLLEYKNKKIVVSTVGSMIDPDGSVQPTGCYCYYETMVFHSDKKDKKYHDIDVSKQIFDIDCEDKINKKNKDNEANEMHENVVNEIIKKLELNKLKA